MAQPITQLYDKMMKKILTLSSKAVINFINGLFDTHYDTNSQITYNWTEFEDHSLKRILADTILTINNTDSYHIEAQMYTDDAIILRVFEYGFSHALRNAVIHEDYCEIQFPNPAIIYLYYDGTVPDTYQLHVTFPDQQTIIYTAPVLKLPDISAEELNKRKMVILLPFHLLKMRRLLEKSRSDANKEALKNILFHDILGTL